MSALTLKQRLYQRYWQLLSRYLDKRQPASSKVQLVQKIIFILPTRYGWWFLLLVVLLYLLGTNYQNNLILLLSYLLLSVFLLSIVLCYQNMSGLTLQCPQAAQGYAGEPLTVTLLLASARGTEHQHAMLSFNLLNQHEVITLPHLSQTLSLSIETTHRGRYTLPRVQVSSQYPFGLWRAWSYAAIAQEYWVYPAPESHTSVNTDAALNQEATEHTQPSGDVLAPYRSGDNLRHLVWKRLARDPANPVVRQQLATSEAEPSWVVVPAASGETLERALRQACRQLLTLEHAGGHYGLKLPHLTIAQSSGPVQLQRCLQALALC